jgi:prepilin-type processing-associated H-X9-DG protein
MPDGTYDGIIVRSPFQRWEEDQQTTRIPGIEGEFVSGVPQPIEMAKVTDGASNTIAVTEKYVRADWYTLGEPSDNRGWSDGWDPDIMRTTGIPPLNDTDVNPPFTGRIGDDPGTPNGRWETLVTGSAHSSGMHCVFADGSVHTINYDIDVFVFNALGTRNGEETVKQEGWN